MNLDAAFLSSDSLARASVILAVGLLLLFSSIATICILRSNEALRDVIGTYLISLAFADLLCGVLIVPLSMFSSLSPTWRFLGNDSLFCKCSSYLQVVLISSTIYTFAWISVDRYAAFMKPSRYEVEHTMTRCKCWIAFSWSTAVLAAVPLIVAKMEVNYYQELELCVINWASTKAYSITLAVLVLVPSMCTVLFSSGAIFIAMNKPEELEDNQRTVVETDPNFVITLFIFISFVLFWLPILVLQFMPVHLISPSDTATMKFAFVWLAIGGSSSKLLIYMSTNREFRHSFCSLCFPSHSSDNGNSAPLVIDEQGESSCCCIPKSAAASPAINNLQVARDASADYGRSVEYGSFARSPY